MLASVRVGGYQRAVDEQPERHGLPRQGGAGDQRLQGQPAGPPSRITRQLPTSGVVVVSAAVKTPC